MRTKSLAGFGGLSAVLFGLAVAPAWAHHSFPAEFDANKPVKMRGIVKKVEWINPHSWITIEVKQPDGTVQTWEIECGAPNAMFRQGFTKDSLPIGTEIVVDGYLAKNGKQRANGRDLTLPDGTKLFLASSAPDAQDKNK
jgi:uncharacterized protein DUF6152